MLPRILLLLALTLMTCARAQPLPLLSVAQVTDTLYETANWYRALGSLVNGGNEQLADDGLILYANRQIASQVVHQTLDMARADAELISSAASQAAAAAGVANSTAALNSLQARLESQAHQVQVELQSARAVGATDRARGSYAAAKLSELEGELTVINARSNLVATMAQYVNESDAQSAGANALKQHIAAIDASLPSVTASTGGGGGGGGAGAVPALDEQAVRRLGIWDLTAGVLQLSGTASAIETLDRNTVALDTLFRQLLSTPTEAVKGLSERSDALSAQADHAGSAAMGQIRDQLDTVAWQFKQTSAIVLAITKARVLLEQYRHNLAGWRQLVERRERSALIGLAVRIGTLAAVLVALFAGAGLWRRLVLRYEHEPRRRHQWLLVRRFTLWTLVIAVIGLAFVTQLSSMATFAGLITAGLAVAMQSVLVSVVGYFLLIGKYGVRVGDRVQIGEVVGEVVELGVVRMHLMELNAEDNFHPTGRIVAFANAIVFQASGGLFRQIPEELWKTIGETGSHRVGSVAAAGQLT